jgi:acyl transferase domain-containing protein
MLVNKRSGQMDEVPKNRFDIDAYYHENLERPGSFNVRGGYFLDGSLDDIDPTAFNMTPVEAQWLDPQQRKMLEVSYECFESAGMCLPGKVLPAMARRHIGVAASLPRWHDNCLCRAHSRRCCRK